MNWAIIKGRRLTEKCLAVAVDDPAMASIDSEGSIPEGEYGAGAMTVSDTGTFDPLIRADERTEIFFHRRDLTGRYNHIRFVKGGEDVWLIVRSRQ